MPNLEIQGSNRCIIRTSLSSSADGVTGYRVRNAGKLSVFSIPELTVYIINQDRGTITFCLQRGPVEERTATYHTYMCSKINIETVSRDKEPLLSQAEDLFKQG